MKKLGASFVTLFAFISTFFVLGIAHARGTASLTDEQVVRFFNRDTYSLSHAFQAYIPTPADVQSKAKTQTLRNFLDLLLADESSLPSALTSRGIRATDEEIQAWVKDAQAITSQTALTASQSVSAGNVGQFMANNVSVTGYEVEQPSNKQNAAYGDRIANLLSTTKTQVNFFDNGSVALDAAPEPVPQGGNSNSASSSSDSKAARRIVVGIGVHPFGREFGYRAPNIWKIGLHAPHSFIEVDAPGLSKLKTGVSQTILKGPTQVGGNGLGTNYYEQVVDQLNGWRTFPVFGAGFEKNVKKFTIVALTHIGWSKDGGEVVKDQIIQKSLGGSSVAQSRNLWSSPADSVSFYSTIGGQVIYNVKPWLGVYGEYGRILSGGPSNSVQTSVVTPGFTSNVHAIRNTAQVGVTLNLDHK